MQKRKGMFNSESAKEAGIKSRKSKELRTSQWELLSMSLTNGQAQNFMSFMEELWKDKGKEKKQARIDKELAADLFLRTIEYFKPKYSRVDTKIQSGDTVHEIRFISE